MSERLEPGRLVRWQHEGGWKVGNVLYEDCRWDDEDWQLVVQSPEGVYLVSDSATEPHPTRKESGEV